MGEDNSEFLREAWTLYGVGAVILLLRFVTRMKTVGFKGFQGDDYMSIIVLALLTMDAATVHIISFSGTNVEASEIQRTRPLTGSEISQYEFGSKEQIAAWYSYTGLIWALKGTMLFFFNRLTFGLWQHRYVKWLGATCVASYIAVVFTITFGCFPIQKNWQVVPDPGLKCTLKLQNFLVTVVLNVITDAAILVIPLPLLWGLKIPLQRKIVIGIFLCSGVFIISAAIIRVVLTLKSNASALNINRWGVRETIVGIIAVNLPVLKPLFSKRFWSTRPFKSTALSHDDHSLTHPGTSKPHEMNARLTAEDRVVEDWEEANIGTLVSGRMSHGSKSVRSFASGGSQTNILERGGDVEEGVVQVETTYEVMSERKGEAGVGGMEGWQMGVSGGVNKVSVHAEGLDSSSNRGSR